MHSAISQMKMKKYQIFVAEFSCWLKQQTKMSPQQQQQQQQQPPFNMNQEHSLGNTFFSFSLSLIFYATYIFCGVSKSLALNIVQDCMHRTNVSKKNIKPII